MSSIEKAKRVVARLTEEDMRKLRHCINECLIGAIEFEETRKPEYFIKMKCSIEQFLETLKRI
jgi:hypothetical protein